ncbi:MAG: flippase [Anaerolineae bacterium]|nr:flippase [Anaerolineae bacterium]
MTQPEGALPGSGPAQSDASLLPMVARNSAFVFGSQVLIRIVAFAFNVYVVRRLGAVQFGRYATVMAYVALFGIFTDLGLAPYSVREMAEDRSRTAWLLPNSIAIRTLLSLAIAVIAPLSALWLGKEDDLVTGILIASAGQLVWAVQGPLGCALIARERLDYDAAFSFVERVVFWVLGTLVLVSGGSFIGLIVASLVAVGVRAICSGWVLLRRLGVGRLDVSVRHWPGMVRAALSFGVSSIAFTLRNQFDTLLMSFVLTDQAVGWYNVPYNLIGMLLLLAFSVGQAMYPSMARAYVVDPAAMATLIRRAVKYLLVIALPITVGGTILARPVVILLYTQEFEPSVRILQVMLWALPALFLLELLGRLANALHLERELARVTVINAVITIVLDLLLVPTLGAAGAALALLGGRVVNLVQNWRLVNRGLRFGIRWGEIGRTVLAAVLMGGLVFLLRDAFLVLPIGVGALAYVALLFGLGVLTWSELVQLGRMVFVRRVPPRAVEAGGKCE